MAVVPYKNNSQNVVFQCGGTTIFSSLIKAKIPDWRALLIGNDTACATIRCGDLLSAIEQITVIDKKDDDPEMTMTFRDGQLELKNKRSDIPMPVVFTGAATVQIKPYRLTSMLKVLDADTSLEFHLKTDKPVMVRTSDGFSYLAMPVTVGEPRGVRVEEQKCA
jgi:DNA polymerase III sliding clamp (beta) subunit (PCNA family)